MNTNNRITLWTDTLNPIIDFRRDFDRHFDDWLSAQRIRSESHFTPLCDIGEQEDHFHLTLEMAGVKKDDLKMEVIDNQILISGERRNATRKRPEDHLYSERYFGKFQRSFTLPPNIDASKVEANYEDGILHVVIPKSESAKPRQIKIGSGNSPSKFFGRLLNQSKEKEEQNSTNVERAAS